MDEWMALGAGVVIGAAVAGLLGVSAVWLNSLEQWWADRRRRIEAGRRPRYVDVHSLKPEGYKRVDIEAGEWE